MAYKIGVGHYFDDVEQAAFDEALKALKAAMEESPGPGGRQNALAALIEATRPMFSEGELRCALRLAGVPLRPPVEAMGPWLAYQYARYFDKAPRDDTRAAACGDPQWAYRYALDVDAAPRDLTRAAACGHPDWAFLYALDVDKTPRYDTRWAVLPFPHLAYRYARELDKSPRDDTRAAVKGSDYEVSYRKWEERL